MAFEASDKHSAFMHLSFVSTTLGGGGGLPGHLPFAIFLRQIPHPQTGKGEKQVKYSRAGIYQTKLCIKKKTCMHSLH
jgi:hypothetical protein